MKKKFKTTMMLFAVCFMISAMGGMFTQRVEAAAKKIEISSKNFPNQNFRKALQAYDDDGDGFLVISQIKSLDLSEKGISNLRGIEYFTGLTELICSYNNLSSLDLRKNTALTELYCDGNKLSTLSLTKNTRLVKLSAASNALTGIDLHKNTELTTLNLGQNSITNLDLSSNGSLVTLDVSENKLTSLSLSGNRKLRTLDCFHNRLKSLSLTKNKGLKELTCDENALTSLKVDKCTKLVSLDCAGNKLTSLDVTKNTSLTDLICNDNKLNKLNLTKNRKLKQLNAGNNSLTSLDLKKNTLLETVDVRSNKFNTLDLSGTGFTADDLKKTLFAGKTVAITWKDKTITVQADHVGKTFKLKSGTYQITTMGKQVALVKPASRSAKTITIPATVKIRNLTYKVTSISAGAFKNHKNLSYLIVGKNMKKIERKAFYGCRKLKRVTFQGSKLKTVEEKAFASTKKNLVVKAPKKVLKSYKTMLTEAGAVVK